MKIDFDLKKINYILIDFDDTIYRNGSWRGFQNFIYDYFNNLGFIEKNLKNYDDVANLFDKDFHELQVFALYLRKIGKPVDELYKFLDENIYNIIEDDTVHIDEKYLKNASNVCKIYLVSDSREKYLLHYLSLFRIDANLFAGIKSNDYLDDDMKKIHVMEKLISTLNAEKNEILMIGDSYFNDILSAKKLGINAIQIQSIEDTENILDAIFQAKSL